MASYSYTFTSGDSVTPTKLNSARTISEIVDADIKSDAAIAHSKLASIASGQVLLGNASNVPTATAVSGDVTISNAGVTAIGAGVIVDADVNAAAAIALTKLATGALPAAITVASANIVDGTIVNADINASAAIADTKLATISAAGKVSNSATTATDANTASAIVARDASGNFSAGTITAAAFTGPVTGNLTGTASAIADGSVSTAKIVDGAVTNAKIASGVDASKLTTGTLPIARIADAAVTAAKLNGAQTGSAPIFGVRAWGTFVGQASNGACSFTGGNVTSVTRVSNSVYEVVMATAMPDANYAVVCSALGTARLTSTAETSTTFRLDFINASGTAINPEKNAFIVIR